MRDYLLGLPASPIAEKGVWYVVFPLVLVILLTVMHRTIRDGGKQKSPSGISEAA